MTTFRYTAKSDVKKQIAGTIEADSIISAAHSLRLKGLFPVDIELKSLSKNKAFIFKVSRPGKVSKAVLAEFTEQLANLLDSGLPLQRSLKLLEHQLSCQRLKSTLAKIASSISSGKALAEALSDYPKTFTVTYVNMIKVGEESGLLAEMLKRLSKSLYEQYHLRSRLKAAMVYPVFLILVGLGTIVVLMTWVIPKFSSFFNSLESQLPLPTRMVITASSFLARIWPVLLISSTVCVLLSIRIMKSEKIKIAFDKFCLSIPIIKEFIIKSQLSQLMRTLGTLLSHGVNMLGALSIAGDTLSNKFIASLIAEIKTEVSKGQKLCDSFNKCRIFPQAVVGIIAIGQEGGTLPEMFIKLSQQYEHQTERQVKVLTSMIEPVMILVMGGVVGFVVISMLLPIFKVSTLVH